MTPPPSDESATRSLAADALAASGSGTGLPATISGFRIDRLLGRGGMGAVYLAWDADLHRAVAVKTVRPDLAARPGVAERFLREARATAQIDHDHVVPVYAVGQEGGCLFLVMPVLKGESLDDRLKRAAVPVREAVRVAREMADGLAAAHAVGLIHRDIKPANVWVDGATGKVKLLDFGLARTADGPDGLTHEGTIVGTPAYMAPEQAAGKPVDPRTDLFSLGCVLYQMATGQKPFAGPDILSVLHAVASHTPPQADKVNPAVPRPLADLIGRLLSKDPAGRPASAVEASAVLAELENEVSAVVTLVEPKRFPVGLAVGVAGLVAVVAVGGWLVTRPAPAPESPGPTASVGPSPTPPADGPSVPVVPNLPPDFPPKLPTDLPKLPPPPAIPKSPGPNGPFPPLDPAWAKQVAALPTTDLQLQEVEAEMKRRNPGWAGFVRSKKADGGPGQNVTLARPGLTDLTPLRALPKLDGVSLVQANASAGTAPLRNLEPLRGLPLTRLNVNHSEVEDLSPLADMRLVVFGFHATKVTDLTAVRAARIEDTQFDPGALNDAAWEVVRGWPLKRLRLHTYTHARDGDRLTKLLDGNKGLSDVGGLPLNKPVGDPDADGLRGILRRNPQVTTIDNEPATAYLAKYPPNPKGPFPPLDPALVKRVNALPTFAEQMQEVEKDLKARNPGWAGFDPRKVPNGYGLDDEKLVTVRLYGEGLVDLTPLQAVPKLESVFVSHRPKANAVRLPLATLVTLDGPKPAVGPRLQLKKLFIPHTDVDDLSPVAGMPLFGLGLDDTKVKTLVPIRASQVYVLHVGLTQFKDAKDADVWAVVRGWPVNTLHVDGYVHKDHGPKVAAVLDGNNKLAEVRADVLGKPTPDPDGDGLRDILRARPQVTKIGTGVATNAQTRADHFKDYPPAKK